MCVGQANLWAATNTAPEERGSEIMPTEPYLLGSHSGCCGIWVSGPDEAWVPEDYKVRAANGKVYNRMTTVEGLFTCADGVGASGHKFSSGSHAEGRIAGKQMVRWCLDHKDFKPEFKETAEELKQLNYRPYYNYLAGKDASTDPVVNPNYITPKNFMMRLVKCTDEYGGGVGTYYTTSKALLDTGFYLLGMMKKTPPSWPPATCTNCCVAGKTTIACGPCACTCSTSPSVKSPVTPASTTAPTSWVSTTASGSAS